MSVDLLLSAASHSLRSAPLSASKVAQSRHFWTTKSLLRAVVVASPLIEAHEPLIAQGHPVNCSILTKEWRLYALVILSSVLKLVCNFVINPGTQAIKLRYSNCHRHRFGSVEFAWLCTWSPVYCWGNLGRPFARLQTPTAMSCSRRCCLDCQTRKESASRRPAAASAARESQPSTWASELLSADLLGAGSPPCKESRLAVGKHRRAGKATVIALCWSRGCHASCGSFGG